MVNKDQSSDSIKARYVIHANGFLNRPKLPAMKGINDYTGHTFHTSRWDYDYTGGDSNGNLNNLKDKTVAIIGTGATAVQCVPHLAAGAKKLYVFKEHPLLSTKEIILILTSIGLNLKKMDGKKNVEKILKVS